MSIRTTSAPAPTSRSDVLALGGFGLAVLLVAVLGGFGASGSSSTYADLDKPFFAPPSWLFGPVWTVLYVMIAVAGWLVWRQVTWDRALTVYAVQLVLNAAWTPLFFGSDRYGLALVEILLLLAAVVATIVLFWGRSRVAALLLVPYAAWVAFATALNAGIWVLNR